MPIIGERSKSSTLGNVAGVIFEALGDYGVDARALFAQAGVALPVWRDPENRLSFRELESLLSLALRATRDDAFGLRFGERIHPTTFHALGLALLSSNTIRAFCQRLARYYSFITTNERIELHETDRGLDIRLIANEDVRKSPVFPVLMQGSFSTYVEWLRAMYRRDYAPCRMAFSFPEPRSLKPYRAFFRAPLRFGAEVDAISIAHADLDVPLPAANAELARMHDEVVVKTLAKLDERDLVRRVHAKIIQLLPSGRCSKPTIAHSLNMSVRTLHNRLAAEGTSYQEILVDIRRELAEQYIEQRSLSVTEIAYTLGFSDCSNFSRAFQRWTGCSPTEFRQRLAAGSAD